MLKFKKLRKFAISLLLKLIYVTLNIWHIFEFLVADTQLYKRLCPSICQSVCPSIGPWWSSRKEWKCCSYDCLRVWVGMGWKRACKCVVCPCPPNCNNIMTLGHLFLLCSEELESYTDLSLIATWCGRRSISSEQGLQSLWLLQGTPGLEIAQKW